VGVALGVAEGVAVDDGEEVIVGVIECVELGVTVGLGVFV